MYPIILRIVFVLSTHLVLQQSVKFDDLCSNFKQHEDLDKSGGYVTMTLKPDKSVSSMAYVDGSGAGLVPLTIPTVDAASVSTSISPSDSVASCEYTLSVPHRHGHEL